MNVNRKMNKHRRMSEGSMITIPHSDSIDRITGLPDDVIRVILSFLGLKDAARTSLLSKRWRYSWTYFLDLDFDAENCLGWGFGTSAEKEARYVKWVSDVVLAHRAPIVRKFRASFEFDGTYALDIDRWVNFCSRKGVQELELNCCGLYGIGHKKLYNFDSIEQTIHHPQDACVAPAFSNLMSFSVASLRISGASLEFMLSKCLLLERLSLVQCRGLGSLRLAGSSIKLKYFKMKFCVVDKVEISAPNVVTVECWSESGIIVIKSVPSLVEASFYGSCANEMFEQMSCWSFQLEKLLMFFAEVNYKPTSIPPLVNVKQLSVGLYIREGHNLHNWLRLIDVCPSLREFNLGISRPWGLFLRRKTNERQMEVTNFIHPHLEAFHFAGFFAREFDIEFASYVLKIFPMLKKLILDSRKPWPPIVCNAVCDPPHFLFPLVPRLKCFVEELARSHPALDVVIT